MNSGQSQKGLEQNMIKWNEEHRLGNDFKAHSKYKSYKKMLDSKPDQMVPE